MKTVQEMIEVMQHFANAGEIELIQNGTDDDNGWEFTPDPGWDWIHFNYRKKEPAKQKIKMLCWLSHAGYLTWGVETADIPELWIRVPSEDKDIEV